MGLDQVVVAREHDRVLGEVDPEAGGQDRDHELAVGAIGVGVGVVVSGVGAEEREIRELR
jgi:hypothetical protein